MAKLAAAAGIRVILCAVPPASLNGPNLNTSKIEIFDRELATLAGANSYRYADYFHAMLLPDGSQDLTLFVWTASTRMARATRRCGRCSSR